MATLKRYSDVINDMREEQKINKRMLLGNCNKRLIWNARRRFGY